MADGRKNVYCERKETGQRCSTKLKKSCVYENSPWQPSLSTTLAHLAEVVNRVRCMATLDVTVQVLSAQGDDQAMHSMIVNRLENLRPTRLQECLLLS